ncbi:MAG: hypothetical protein AB7I19_06860 [Planctomycetota bacterium]
MKDADKPENGEGEGEPDDRLEKILAELARPGGFLEKMTELLDRFARYHGIGDWRLRADAVDLAQIKVIQRILNPSKPIPRNLPAYARSVFRNVVRKGPRVALSRDGALGLGEQIEEIADATDALAKMPEGNSRHLPADFGFFGLTEPERRAIEAFTLEESTKKRAERTGMSEWNYRTRVKRAVSKIRRGISRAEERQAAEDATNSP